KTDARCKEMARMLEYLGKGFTINFGLKKESLSSQYLIEDAYADLVMLQEKFGSIIDDVNHKRADIDYYKNFKKRWDSIVDKEIDFDLITTLNYFDYEICTLSKENRTHLRKNYENISAVALNIDYNKNSSEGLYIIIYPKRFKEETVNLLKSLNREKLDIPGGLHGTVHQMIDQVEERIDTLENEIDELTIVLNEKKEETFDLLSKIYTSVELEKSILSLKKEVIYSDITFVLNAWVRQSDKYKVAQLLSSYTNKIIIEEKESSPSENEMMPPTQFKNNWFFKPFETIVRLYGLPSYYEIDPTPFLALTFCLMFGIMFGDIGQGAVYFLAGLFMYRKISVAGQLLTRLGGSSILFGLVYGSFFGLEQAELPWLPSLIGRPLNPVNIPKILLAGVVFGVVVLTVSFIFGVINRLRRGHVQEGIFGKNGIAGYVFFISLVMCGVMVTGAIDIPMAFPVVSLLLSIVVMLLKEPLTNLVMNKRPLVHGNMGSYLTESIFEGVETVLGTLSNTVSFIRVGAFALNHAGLFLAFLVMSEMTSNIVLKFIILVLGNVLILTLEGLVVFIQGLRLEYYEMFGKYFQGEGIPFNPVKMN
ncbi:MAG TPA: hypothetical protein DDZ89_14015, partial [Clostridiales bacterium]|nr:hypothetical protein [Clostridiales bacterium]